MITKGNWKFNHDRTSEQSRTARIETRMGPIPLIGRDPNLVWGAPPLSIQASTHFSRMSRRVLYKIRSKDEVGKAVKGIWKRTSDFRRSTMHWEEIQKGWDQFKGMAKEKWGKLDDADLDAIGGDREKLIARLQELYGCSREQAETELKEFSWDPRH